jgi:hypothetical protein
MLLWMLFICNVTRLQVYRLSHQSLVYSDVTLPYLSHQSLAYTNIRCCTQYVDWAHLII